MLKCLLIQIKKNPPIMTMALIFSCLISTIPQFFLPEAYSVISGEYQNLKQFYLLTLPSFTHTPGMLMRHLGVNLLVFLLFGSLTEIIIGSSRVSFIYLLTFISTTVVNFLHASVGSQCHGASGICWGLHIFFVFIMIIIYEQKGKRVNKDIFVLIVALLASFDLFGIPILEVVVLKQRFFDNFGQTVHLVSMVIVVPFILLWRKDIERSVVKFLAYEIAKEKRKRISVPAVLTFILITINTYGTIKLAMHSDYVTYNVIPAQGTNIKQIPKYITIRFDSAMKVNTERLVNTSIYYEDNQGEPKFNTRWLDDRTLEIIFSRSFVDNETLRLEYIAEAKNGISRTDTIVLDYK